MDQESEQLFQSHTTKRTFEVTVTLDEQESNSSDSEAEQQP